MAVESQVDSAADIAAAMSASATMKRPTPGDELLLLQIAFTHGTSDWELVSKSVLEHARKTQDVGEFFGAEVSVLAARATAADALLCRLARRCLHA